MATIEPRSPSPTTTGQIPTKSPNTMARRYAAAMGTNPDTVVNNIKRQNKKEGTIPQIICWTLMITCIHYTTTTDRKSVV
jgi:hypothetical protein